MRRRFPTVWRSQPSQYITWMMSDGRESAVARFCLLLGRASRDLDTVTAPGDETSLTGAEGGHSGPRCTRFTSIRAKNGRYGWFYVTYRIYMGPYRTYGTTGLIGDGFSRTRPQTWRTFPWCTIVHPDTEGVNKTPKTPRDTVTLSPAGRNT